MDGGVTVLFGFSKFFIAFPFAVVMYQVYLNTSRDRGRIPPDWMVNLWSAGITATQLITLFNEIHPYPVKSWQSLILFLVAAPSLFIIMRMAIRPLHEADKAHKAEEKTP